MELAYRLAVDDAPYVKNIRDHVDHADHADRRSRRTRPRRRRLQLEEEAPERRRAERDLLGPLRRARQQPRRDGHDAQAHAEHPQRVRRLEGAGAARPARVGRVHVRQHDRRRPVQLVARSARDERVAADRLEQRAGDDALRHAGRVRARQLRHVVAGLPDVHRRDAQRHQPSLRDVRQRRQRRHAGAHPRRRTTRSAAGSSRTRRCRA